MSVNAQIAAKLREMADVLEQQDASAFRVNAYRRAALTVDALKEEAPVLLRRAGHRGLVALPGVGEGIASAIAEMCATGRWSQLERLTGALEPERLFQTIPGVGPELAGRLHADLGVDTLEQLEMAAHDGRLERVAGVGSRRATAIRAYLADRLGRRRLRLAQLREPSVALLLDIDRIYRERAAAGMLRTIAPRRFNPSGDAWLPIMHESRGKWRVTALFSNTANAHKLRKNRDWVVIYFNSNGAPEGQRTIVTETRGPSAGKRIVRGREAECERFYQGAARGGR
jgi:putative hydrolase